MASSVGAVAADSGNRAVSRVAWMLAAMAACFLPSARVTKQIWQAQGNNATTQQRNKPVVARCSAANPFCFKMSLKLAFGSNDRGNLQTFDLRR